MFGKLMLRLAPAATLALLAVAPAVAQAEPHWYIGSNRIPEGKKVTLKTGGTLTLTETSSGSAVTCTVADAETVVNPIGGGAGLDSMKAFKLTNCGPSPCHASTSGVPRALVVKAVNLPWASKLVGVSPIADELTGVELKFQCKGSSVFKIYAGTLSPWVGAGLLEFNSPTTGMLGTLAVNGIDNILAPLGVNAQNP